MTIVIVTVTFPSISETFIANKVLQLAKRGHSVHVICSNVNSSLFTKLFQGVNNVFVIAIDRKRMLLYAAKHPSLLLGSGNKSLHTTLINETRAWYINKCKPDVVHIEFSGLGVLYMPVLHKIAAKKIVSCRGSAEKVKLLNSKEKQEQTRELFKLVDAIHCVSADMKDTIMPYCQDEKKVFINFPSIDAAIFKRTKVYQLQKHIQILSIGRLTFQKGYLTGLMAIKKLKSVIDNFTWTIIGDGPLMEELVFHIHTMGLQNHVVLAGAKGREEIIKAYNTSSIFFLPSVYEGIANVVLEAMSMELPVVCTKSGGMQEVITHNYNGMLADVYDDTALCDNILALTQSEDICKKMGVLARQRIMEQFTLEKQADIFEDMYNKLAKN